VTMREDILQMFSGSQLAALQYVSRSLMEDPKRLDNRKECPKLGHPCPETSDED
jgi:hypothetical protein